MLGFKLFTQSIEKVVFENTYQDHFERSGPRPEWKLGPRLSLRFETYNSKVTLVCEHDKSVFSKRKVSTNRMNWQSD